mmetsp:Transcript_101005/g.240709  ORF Transcript_101005/g.240709 Transcript_101005/m.240709 type:complete len:226 (-) Transcript_101005:129-806(-)
MLETPSTPWAWWTRRTPSGTPNGEMSTPPACAASLGTASTATTTCWRRKAPARIVRVRRPKSTMMPPTSTDSSCQASAGFWSTRTSTWRSWLWTSTTCGRPRPAPTPAVRRAATLPWRSARRWPGTSSTRGWRTAMPPTCWSFPTTPRTTSGPTRRSWATCRRLCGPGAWSGTWSTSGATATTWTRNPPRPSSQATAGWSVEGVAGPVMAGSKASWWGRSLMMAL